MVERRTISRWWYLGTAVLTGLVALLFATFGFAAIEENGYRCGDFISSVKRPLPWSQRETLIFWAHVALYPIAVFIGGSTGVARSLVSENRPNYGIRALCSIVIFIIVAVTALIAQSQMTDAFMHFDTCGTDFFDNGLWVGNVLPPAAAAATFASVAGLLSFVGSRAN